MLESAILKKLETVILIRRTSKNNTPGTAQLCSNPFGRLDIIALIESLYNKITQLTIFL